MAEKPLVAIDCLVYNHAPYLRDCFEGFVRQKTRSPFVVVVHDDASTDESATIISEYVARYPHLFIPIYETENRYARPDRLLGRIMDAAIDATEAKYVAMCEGDDYWTEPEKLQRQVDFMEVHEAYSLCCHRYRIYNQDADTWEEDYMAERFADGKNVKGFAFGNLDNMRCWIAKTNTLLYRRAALDNELLRPYRYSRDVHRVYHLLKNAQGYCLPWYGAVYRRQQGGVFSSLNGAQKQRTSFLIYAELLQRNMDDAELAAYFGELYSVYRDNLRCAVQQHQATAGELLEFLTYAYRFYGLQAVGYAIRKFCLSWWKAIRNSRGLCKNSLCTHSPSKVG